MNARVLPIFLMIFASVCPFAAQESDNNEEAPVIIPENIKKEIVRRILIYKFEPARRPKIIYLAGKELDPAWIPKIANVEFRLLLEADIEDRQTGIYFFTDPHLDKETYDIGFAFGNPFCNYSGTGWSFRLVKRKVRLWPDGRLGGGCGGGGTNFVTPGKLNTYPNELKGLKFFNQGKLKELQLSVSTREEILKNFGSNCENLCDYDDKWMVDFSYFNRYARQVTANDKTTKYVPKEEYIGTLSTIRLMPKQRFSLSRVVFPRIFNKSGSFSIADGWDASGFTSAVGTSYDTYTDRYGLKYELFSKTAYTVGKVEKSKQAKGDLVSIAYTIPDKIEETMFVAEP